MIAIPPLVRFTCDYCGVEKDEMLFPRTQRWKESRTGRQRRCRSCGERSHKITWAEAKVLRIEAQKQRSAMIVAVNKAFPLLPVQTRLRMVEWLLEKKWTIEAVMNLHKVPKEVAWKIIPRW